MMTKAALRRAVIWTAANTHLRHNRKRAAPSCNDNSFPPASPAGNLPALPCHSENGGAGFSDRHSFHFCKVTQP